MKAVLSEDGKGRALCNDKQVFADLSSAYLQRPKRQIERKFADEGLGLAPDHKSQSHRDRWLTKGPVGDGNLTGGRMRVDENPGAVCRSPTRVEVAE